MSMKIWLGKFEWMSLSNCGGDSRFLTPPERLSESDRDEVEFRCHQCVVRPECLRHVIDNEEDGVWSCGTWVPEISLDDTPRRAKQILEEAEEVRAVLAETYEAELGRRGEF